VFKSIKVEPEMKESASATDWEGKEKKVEGTTGKKSARTNTAQKAKI